MNERTLRIYDDSLRRCTSNPRFLDRFYETFMASSPEVRAKFAGTDLVRQKRALRASLNLMMLAAEGDKAPERYLRDLASRHGKADLGVGSALYDLWLDSLLATVREFDPDFGPEIEEAWESVMTVGIEYMVSHYNDAPRGVGPRS
jgi:hemoglobin-like flavoprotein